MRPPIPPTDPSKRPAPSPQLGKPEPLGDRDASVSWLGRMQLPVPALRRSRYASVTSALATEQHTAKKVAKVKARWHDLRHTAVTRLLENGQTLPMVASIMGWSPSTTVRMAQRYGHISTDARRAAMETMNAPRPALADEKFESVEAVTDKSGAVH